MRNELTALTGFRFGGRAPRVLPVIALLAGALCLAACGGGGSGDTTPPTVSITSHSGGGGGGPPAAEEPAPSSGGAPAGPIERVSLHSVGSEADGGSRFPTISGDGLLEDEGFQGVS